MSCRERLLEIITAVENGGEAIDQFVDEIRDIVEVVDFASCCAPEDFEDFLRIFKFLGDYEFELYLDSSVYGNWFYQLYCNPDGDENLRRQLSDEYCKLVDEETIFLPEDLMPVLQAAYKLRDSQFVGQFMEAYMFNTDYMLEDLPEDELGRWVREML